MEPSQFRYSLSSYSNTGLTASTTYYYRVCATNSAGNSAYSNTASAATSSNTPPTSTAPTAPSGLTASAVSSSQIKLQWKDNSSNETGFRIEKSSYSREGSSYRVIATVGPNVTTYTDTGLNASRRYSYRVRAFNAVGASGSSNVASATTLAKGRSDDSGDDGSDEYSGTSDGSKDSGSGSTRAHTRWGR